MTSISCVEIALSKRVKAVGEGFCYPIVTLYIQSILNKCILLLIFN